MRGNRALHHYGWNAVSVRPTHYFTNYLTGDIIAVIVVSVVVAVLYVSVSLDLVLLFQHR
jgi:hypothetical protein